MLVLILGIPSLTVLLPKCTEQTENMYLLFDASLSLSMA